MKHKKPSIENGVYYHIYQRTVDRTTLFKSSNDALFFISVYMMYSIRYHIETISFCLMDNHFHVLCRASESSLMDFVRDCTSFFAVRYNHYHKRTGPLFQRGFGYAAKYGGKKIRTCISYINNNPVEAHLVDTMDKYVWNLFAFGYSSNPFSLPIRLKQSSQKLRRSLKEVDAACQQPGYLPYTVIEHIFEGLAEKERLQLRDYILKKCSPVNYMKIRSIFGDWDKALLAITSFMGSEYDIKM